MATMDCKKNEEEIKARKNNKKKTLMYLKYSNIKGLALWETQHIFQGKKNMSLWWFKLVLSSNTAG